MGDTIYVSIKQFGSVLPLAAAHCCHIFGVLQGAMGQFPAQRCPQNPKCHFCHTWQQPGQQQVEPEHTSDINFSSYLWSFQVMWDTSEVGENSSAAPPFLEAAAATNAVRAEGHRHCYWISQGSLWAQWDWKECHWSQCPRAQLQPKEWRFAIALWKPCSPPGHSPQSSTLPSCMGFFAWEAEQNTRNSLNIFLFILFFLVLSSSQLHPVNSLA